MKRESVMSVVVVVGLILSQVPQALAQQYNISSAKDRMEELAPQVARARCDEASDRVYRFGEILYHIRINLRRSQDLLVTLDKVTEEKDRLSGLITRFDQAVARLQTAFDHTQAAINPFEEAANRNGYLEYTDTGGISSYAQALIDGNQEMIDAFNQLKQACHDLAQFYPDPAAVLYDNTLISKSDNMRASFAFLVSGINALLPQLEAIRQNQNLHLQTIPVYLAVKDVWARCGIYLHIFLPQDRTYAQSLLDQISNDESAINHTQGDISEEANNLIKEAEGLLAQTKDICSHRFRVHNRYRVDPNVVLRGLANPDAANPVRRGATRAGQ